MSIPAVAILDDYRRSRSLRRTGVALAGRATIHHPRRLGMAAGGWEGDVPMGIPLAGKRLDVLGLGLLGREVARMGLAFRMDVVAWSENLTAEAAAAHGVRRVEKAELFATAEVISIHLVLSAGPGRSWGILAELGRDETGAILVSVARRIGRLAALRQSAPVFCHKPREIAANGLRRSRLSQL
ncbi:MAG: hypothetical protein IPI73_20220 [Betaproteobacteria bacterium]|nr:hypothetical protein [Betaproteobacteria bacterium]